MPTKRRMSNRHISKRKRTKRNMTKRKSGGGPNNPQFNLEAIKKKLVTELVQPYKSAKNKNFSGNALVKYLLNKKKKKCKDKIINYIASKTIIDELIEEVEKKIEEEQRRETAVERTHARLERQKNAKRRREERALTSAAAQGARSTSANPSAVARRPRTSTGLSAAAQGARSTSANPSAVARRPRTSTGLSARGAPPTARAAMAHAMSSIPESVPGNVGGLNPEEPVYMAAMGPEGLLVPMSPGSNPAGEGSGSGSGDGAHVYADLEDLGSGPSKKDGGIFGNLDNVGLERRVSPHLTGKWGFGGTALDDGDNAG